MEILSYSCFGTIVLFALVYLNLGVTRYRLIKSKSVPVKYFVNYIDKEEYPIKLITSARLLGNMFELPVLFLIACCWLIAIEKTSALIEWSAIIFVVSRYLHAYFFVFKIYVPLRFLWFLVSLIAVICLWWQIALGK